MYLFIIYQLTMNQSTLLNETTSDAPVAATYYERNRQSRLSYQSEYYQNHAKIKEQAKWKDPEYRAKRALYLREYRARKKAQANQ